jgi:hypothetical protein
MWQPFNLQKAITGEPIFTRKGIAIQEWHYFESVTTTHWSVFAVVDGQVTAYTKEGRFNSSESPTKDSPLDLMMKAPIIEKWMNLYHKGDKLYLGMHFNTEEEAKWAYTTDNDCYKKEYLYIKTIKIDNLP